MLWPEASVPPQRVNALLSGVVSNRAAFAEQIATCLPPRADELGGHQAVECYGPAGVIARNHIVVSDRR